jgi:hypothetical protein
VIGELELIVCEVAIAVNIATMLSVIITAAGALGRQSNKRDIISALLRFVTHHFSYIIHDTGSAIHSAK